MTIFDLLFIMLFLATLFTLIASGVLILRGRRASAVVLLRWLGVSVLTYLMVVYSSTALTKRVVLHVGDPQCSDEWCVAVDSVKRTPKTTVAIYDLTLRIFSRARRRAQRENIATDVYLVDSSWKRFDPIPDKSVIPLNTLLQPGEVVTTRREFELPIGARDVALRVGRRAGPGGPPICWVIGECEAFHKGTVIQIYGKLPL